MKPFNDFPISEPSVLILFAPKTIKTIKSTINILPQKILKKFRFLFKFFYRYLTFFNKDEIIDMYNKIQDLFLKEKKDPNTPLKIAIILNRVNDEKQLRKHFNMKNIIKQYDLYI